MRFHAKKRAWSCTWIIHRFYIDHWLPPQKRQMPPRRSTNGNSEMIFLMNVFHSFKDQPVCFMACGTAFVAHFTKTETFERTIITFPENLRIDVTFKQVE